MLRYKYSLQETTPPAAEPLALADVKTHLRIDHSSDDTLLSALITAVRQLCEKVSGLALINRNYSLYLDSWIGREINLPCPPVVSVAAINIYAEDDSSSVYAASNYMLDNKGLSSRIVLKTGSLTPLPTRSANGIEIQYTAGFGATDDDVPEVLKQGMLQLLTYMYANKGDAPTKALELSGAAAIFKSYRKVSLA